MYARRTGLGALAGAAGLLCWSLTVTAGPPNKEKGTPADGADDPRVSVAEARERAKLLHDVYAATLDAVHHHYFRSERPVLPARAMEDVFEEVERQSKIKARWIAVNTQAMSVQHEPQSAFEKKAAAELAAGKTAVDQVEKGYYTRAAVIPLGVGCVGCHTRSSPSPAKTPRFAGLVISIPVKGE